MKTCPRCGDDFDPDSARNKINRIYGEDIYENYYYSEEEEVCAEWALREILSLIHISTFLASFSRSMHLSALGVALTARTAVATTPALPAHVKIVGAAF